MFARIHCVALTSLCFAFATASFAQQVSIDAFGVGKKRDFAQSSAAAPISHEILGDPGGPFHFSADLEGSNLNLLTPPAKVTLPNQTQYPLAGDSTLVEVERHFASQAELDAAFTDSTYSYTAGASTFSISLTPSNGFPTDIPRITNGNWDVQGRLVINASAGTTLLFNNLSSYTSGVGGMVSFDLYSVVGGSAGGELAHAESVSLSGISTDPILSSYTIPAGFLQPNQTYYAELSFTRIGSLNTNLLPAVGVAAFVNTTGFLISTVVPPSAPVVTLLSPSRNVVTPGQNFNLSVSITGTGSPDCQWFHNGRAIVGETTVNFSASNATAADGGWYVVKSRNAVGTTTSETMFVIVAPEVTRALVWGVSLYGIDLTPPGNLTDAVSVSAGTDFIVALRRDGTLTGWGSNLRGRLNLPAGISGVVGIAAGSEFGLALKSDGTVVSWGNGSSGLLLAPALRNVVAVAAGYDFALALKSDGTVVAWSSNYYGATNVPPNLDHVVAIAAGSSHSLALRDDGTVVAWGRNDYGEATIPFDVGPVTAIAAGGQHTILLKSDGTVRAFGWNHLGQSDVPSSLQDVMDVRAGYGQSLALKSNGTVVGWGGGDYLQSFLFPSDLVEVFALSGGVAIDVALRDDRISSPKSATVQLASRTTVMGGSLVLKATATGSLTITYQWIKDGVPLVGETSSILMRSNLQLADGGTYWVIASNAAGSLASNHAGVVILPLAFSTQPLSHAAYAGGSVTFASEVTSSISTTYQWQWNGVNIPGATNATLTLTNIQAVDGGSYTLVATNSFGSVASDPAILTVIPGTGSSGAALGDFDGDGKADLAWTNMQTGQRSMWFLNGNATSGGASLGVVPVDWVVGATADFDGDGKADIFWTNTVTGDRAIWLMNGSTIRTNTFMGAVPADWVISGTGDFNGDGKADLVWTNTTTGDRAMWLMKGSTVIGGGYLGTVPVAWAISGVGDFNGDGKADLVWTNPVTGERSMWFQNGSTTTGGATLNTVPVEWVISGVGDFNGDGKADIFLSNTTTGDRVIWVMNGSTITTNAFMGTVPTDWAISGTGDFNGDGKKDVFWTNTATGDRAMWLLNGATVTGGGFMGTVPVVWKINN